MRVCVCVITQKLLILLDVGADVKQPHPLACSLAHPHAHPIGHSLNFLHRSNPTKQSPTNQKKKCKQETHISSVSIKDSNRSPWNRLIRSDSSAS